MKVTIEMENLQNIIESAAEKNTEQAIKEAIKEIACNKVDEILEDKIEDIVNDSIVGYVDDYLKNTKIQVGNSWSGDGIKEYTVEEYLKKRVTEIFENQKFKTEYKDRWGDKRTKEISFKEYIEEKITVEHVVKPYIDKMAKQVKDDVNKKVKSVFDEAMRTTLAENVFSIVSASDTYRTISNNLKLLGE